MLRRGEGHRVCDSRDDRVAVGRIVVPCSNCVAPGYTIEVCVRRRDVVSASGEATPTFLQSRWELRE